MSTKKERVMEQERNVAATDDAEATPGFPRKKERRAKRKQITDMIRKYTEIYTLKQKLRHLEEQLEQAGEIPFLEQQVIHLQVKEVKEKLTALEPVGSEDPGIRKPKFFFLRDKEERPVVCVCEVTYFGQIYRGLSICSPLEVSEQKFRKATGRKIAFDRAIAAIMFNGNCMPVLREEPKAVMKSVGVDLSGTTTDLILYKSQVGISPTDTILTAAHKPREQKKFKLF
jgi:hypothetical protein